MKLIFSERFEAALVYANQVHPGQVRRKTGMPYIAHLLGVTGIVLEHGGTEEEAIGALLHDAVEDAGGPKRLEDIRTRFGANVADIVHGCTDSDAIPRPPWRDRKAAYLEHLPKAGDSVRLVSAADKLHNARALLRTYRKIGETVFDRYSGGKAGTLWYYRTLVNVFQASGPRSIAEELDRVVAEVEALAREKG
jgi:GTP pyrophosphokinase